MEFNYTEDIKINPDNLEELWIEQGSLFLKYAVAHADALHEKDNAKTALDYEYSKMYLDTKKNWEKYFDSKPTEPAIKEHITAHPDYRKKEKYFINTAHRVNVMLAAKIAFEHRKKALENLVSLRITGFYSEPRRKQAEIQQEKQSRSKTAHAAQQKMLKRKRRT